MTTKQLQPFLAIFERRHEYEAPAQDVSYDPGRMVLVRDGRPVALDPTYEDRAATTFTKIRQETRDDQ